MASARSTSSWRISSRMMSTLPPMPRWGSSLTVVLTDLSDDIEEHVSAVPGHAVHIVLMVAPDLQVRGVDDEHMAIAKVDADGCNVSSLHSPTPLLSIRGQPCRPSGTSCSRPRHSGV